MREDVLTKNWIHDHDIDCRSEFTLCVGRGGFCALRASPTLIRKFAPASVRGEGGPSRGHGCGSWPSNTARIHSTPIFLGLHIQIAAYIV